MRMCKACIAGCLLGLLHAASAAAMAIALNEAGWRSAGKVAFLKQEGFPLGLLKVTDGEAVLADHDFANGTLAFDMKLLGDGIPGVRFRRESDDEAEVFYLRPEPDCRAADDCVQYTPIVHGVMTWDMYPQYQAKAPVLPNDWNHFRLVVSGRRMNVFVNNAAEPTLVVGRLEANTRAGGLAFTGPAEVANLDILPNVVDGLSPVSAPDPATADRSLIRHWQVSAPAKLAYGGKPLLSDMHAVSSWSDIAAEAGGLVNLSRRYGSPTDQRAGAVVWLRTRIWSDRAQSKRVSVAFLRELWVFANGKPVFARENLYYPESARLDPEGRLGLGNGSFALPLRKGENDIAVALDNVLAVGHRHFGWGLEFRLDDPSGVRLRQP